MKDQRAIEAQSSDASTPEGINRRQMFAYSIAGPLLSVGVGLGTEEAAAQLLPGINLPALPTTASGLLTAPLPLTPPDITDFFDVADSINKPSQLTMALVRVDVLENGKLRLFLPRLDQGCGIQTAVGIMLADAMGLMLDQVEVPLEDARNELGPNQITGGSANVRAFDEGMLLITTLLQLKLLTAAGQIMGVAPTTLRILSGGVIAAPGGARLTFGQVSARAAKLKRSDIKTFSLSPIQRTAAAMTGATDKPTPRLDARDIVTGKKRFTLDQVQGDWPQSPKNAAGKGALDLAMPAMVRMAPRINQKFKSIKNLDKVKGMPGVLAVVPPPANKLDVLAPLPSPLDNTNAIIVPYPPAVAVVAETFGQAWDAARALEIEWTGDGSLGKTTDSNQKINQTLANNVAAIPSPVALLADKTVEGTFTYPAAVAASLEVECAIVDAGNVMPGRLEIWAGMQSPQATVNAVALDLGMNPLNAVAHVIPSGGSFGRRLFWDPVQVAAHASQVTKRPIKLMYHRSDDVRHTRGRPQQHHRLKAHVAAGRVVSYEHFASSPRLDTRHGYGDFSTMLAVSPPLGVTQNGPAHLAVEQFFYKTMVASPYNWGVQTKELIPANVVMNTVSYRSVHIQPFRSTEEMLVDELATSMGMDPYSFRMKYLRLDRARAVLKDVYERSGWARYPHVANRRFNRALGLAVHQEAKSFTAAVVEIDARDTTKGVLGKGAKVLKAWIAVDVGKPINVSGLKAQFEGGLAESISLVLDAGLNFVDGLPQEFSYNNYRIARMANFPRVVDINVFKANGEPIGGAGEVGMSATSGAIGNAYRRATGINPRNFPLNGLTTIANKVPAGELPPKPATFG
jgi:isoquinoline 1-oxidoreductase beta subunit